MDYREYSFDLRGAQEFQKDIFIDRLGDLGFESFEETGEGVRAFISDAQVDVGLNQRIDHLKEELSLDFGFIVSVIPPQNWNLVWESNFQPLWIDDRCYVRASFHESRPDAEIEILIEPKMAFGTGHHQTTSLVMAMMLQQKVEGSRVLDMGCGTGILAILAARLGAQDVVAIDYDPVCYDSTVENIRLNEQTHIRTYCGSKEAIPAESYDFIIANINRNILIDQMPVYVDRLAPGGTLIISGFYEEPDLAILCEHAERLGLSFSGHAVQDSWTAARFIF